ncbi:hypothetical protein [Vibrio antiquarius]|uniref:hypothetical protein n=1 Tax=Vibrio antiquarius (strain Ex25) TaxID=150340 RepID=UPI00265AF7E0|nr:hypothetical protein [Vibrio antiquarius]MCR9845771.1 hypothetical protein [Vibrio antiquarius]MCR9911248.1 hypothetical protein [Vibrio antiquarius]
MKNKYILLILSSLLSASANSKEYVVNLYADVQQVVEVELIDESGNPAPISTNMQYELNPNTNGGQVLKAHGIFKNHKLNSNVTGVSFEVIRSLSALTVPGSLDPTSITTHLSLVQSDCDEVFTTTHDIGTANVQLGIPTTLTDGGRLCETQVDHEYQNNMFPSGNYSSELKIAINPIL